MQRRIALRLCIFFFNEPNQACETPVFLPAACHMYYRPSHSVAAVCHNSYKQRLDRSYCMVHLAAQVWADQNLVGSFPVVWAD